MLFNLLYVVYGALNHSDVFFVRNSKKHPLDDKLIIKRRHSRRSGSKMLVPPMEDDSPEFRLHVLRKFDPLLRCASRPVVLLAGQDRNSYSASRSAP